MPFEQYQSWLTRVKMLMKSVLRSEIPYVQELVDYQQASHGKMLRPLLVLFAAQAAGKDNVDTMRAAAAVELMHNATLLHDDVVDQSQIRHNRRTVNAMWNNKASVLLGDYLLAEGLRLMTETRNLAMLDSLMYCGGRLSEGELHQQKQSEELSTDEKLYYQIIECKTASLFGSCARCGALSVGADKALADKLEQIGVQIGLLFQMRDDMLDFEPRYATQIAKPVLHDVYEGKVTLPLILAMRRAGAAEREQMMTLLRSMARMQDIPVQDSDAVCRLTDEQRQVLDFVEKYQGMQLAFDEIERRRKRLREDLAAIEDIATEAAANIASLADFAIDRNF